MDSRLTRTRLFAIAFASLLAWPASAGSLYKVIDSDGTIVFTDVPPPADARIVAQIPLGGTTVVTPAAGTPHYEINKADAAVARANVRVDFAEHELAAVRHELWSPREGLSLAVERTTPGDRARVEYYKKGVQLARRQLTDVLRERQAPMLLAIQ
jgi:hypothetical protein